MRANTKKIYYQWIRRTFQNYFISRYVAINDITDDVINDGENFKEVVKGFVLLTVSLKGEHRLF